MSEIIDHLQVETRATEQNPARLFSRWSLGALTHLDVYPQKLKELYPLGQKNKDARTLIEDGLTTLGEIVTDFIANPGEFEVQSYTTQRQTTDIQVKGKSLKEEETHTVTTYHLQRRGALTHDGWRDQILLIAKESLIGEITKQGRKEINFEETVKNGLFSLYERIQEMKRTQDPGTTDEKRKKLSGELSRLMRVPIEEFQIVYNRSKYNPRTGQPEVWRIAGIELTRTYLDLTVKGLEFFTGKAAVFAGEIEHFSDDRGVPIFESFRQSLVDVAQGMVRVRASR